LKLDVEGVLVVVGGFEAVAEGCFADVSSPLPLLLDKIGFGVEVPLSVKEERRFRDWRQRFLCSSLSSFVLFIPIECGGQGRTLPTCHLLI